MHDHGVTVIIASYRWPEALRISLASALRQTLPPVEVLVIEDGPASATQAVVDELDDTRVQYHALGENSGSQSGPNQLGLSIARAPWVAYLGHDDVWDPRHLEMLIEASSITKANALHSCSLMMDDIPAGRAILAGFSQWTPAAFIPPSSIMHRRTLAVGAPIWADPKTSRQPVDYLATCELHHRGGTFASSGEVTLAKIAAAWRFRHAANRSVTAHQQLLEASSDTRSPSASLARWLQLLQLDNIELEFPAQQKMAPGWGTDHNRRMRGLPPLGSPCTTFDLQSLHADPNWHEPELDGERAIRWTGPGPATTVILDAPHPLSASVEVIFEVVLAMAPITAETPFELMVDGTRTSIFPAPPGAGATVARGTMQFVARVHRESVPVDAPLELLIRSGEPCCPPPTPAGTQDARRLGIAFASISAHAAGADTVGGEEPEPSSMPPLPNDERSAP